MLRTHGHTKACFVGHSLGTAAISWLLHSPTHHTYVASTVLLDPVTFLLFHPAVAYNFVYRPPTTVLELLTHYFVARELYIAHSISRHFNWSRNAVFVEDLPPANPRIVPAHRVARYLGASEGEGEGGAVDVLFYEGLSHGEGMLKREVLERVVGKIRGACGVDVVEEGNGGSAREVVAEAERVKRRVSKKRGGGGRADN
ncbi:hypothetical protein HK104_005377 [Borealophlyctis nickersoniae]|nr:hypothetical protein HK104_005377 [Borealophlyctis nickersoniae]